MDAYKLALKFFLADAAGAPGPGLLVPLLHRWIQAQDTPGHLLIDVADYHHVPRGPGTVLVAHEGNFSLDREEQPGLMYTRKQPLEGDFRRRVRQVLTIALTACRRLEQEQIFGGKLRFRTDYALFRINDRLLAPNTPETFARIKSDLADACAEAYGREITLAHDGQKTQELFEVKILSPADVPVAELLARLG